MPKPTSFDIGFRGGFLMGSVATLIILLRMEWHTDWRVPLFLLLLPIAVASIRFTLKNPIF